jgi:Pentapeptide repeats (8 copies)
MAVRPLVVCGCCVAELLPLLVSGCLRTAHCVRRSGCILRGAVLRGAVLRGAVLRGGVLRAGRSSSGFRRTGRTGLFGQDAVERGPALGEDLAGAGLLIIGPRQREREDGHLELAQQGTQLSRARRRLTGLVPPGPGAAHPRATGPGTACPGAGAAETTGSPARGTAPELPAPAPAAWPAWAAAWAPAPVLEVGTAIVVVLVLVMLMVLVVLPVLMIVIMVVPGAWFCVVAAVPPGVVVSHYKVSYLAPPDFGPDGSGLSSKYSDTSKIYR